MQTGPQPTFVTQPFLPPLAEFIPYLESIWGSKWLTNNGQFHQQLEKALAEYLGVPFISLFSNGTLALITALQALRIGGEVVTTPYSFVATSHALHWNGIRPVFADIDPDSFNLDPRSIEKAINARTTAILPVHVYGRPCDTEAIDAIARKHRLKVIYDAAHAFAVREDGRSILNAGDFSILSFHATKVFNTFEGGAVISPDAASKTHVDDLKNFGFVDETTVIAPGINAKMNEVQAAFGLLQLKHIDEALALRGFVAHRYRAGLTGVPGLTLPRNPANVIANHSYYPVLIEPDFPASRDEVYAALKEQGIHARRYFFPLISDFPTYRDLPSAQPANLPVARTVSNKVLCLPIFPDLKQDVQDKVIAVIRGLAASRRPARTGATRETELSLI
ncbi:MAG TPA: DegT/DnrJ/EryC1/StrS family aminotransferase [Burkholderiales bacterium]